MLHKNLIVQKFGGSSLSTPEQIKNVAFELSRQHRAGLNVIAVVSAMGKTTDQLIDLAHAVSAKPDRRELDMLLSTGERVSMALLSMALHDLQTPSISFTGSQAGVMTDGSHSSANILELKPIRIEEALTQNKIVVLAGFQGVDPKTKEITTLGRGGSDITAVAMAAHFKAERCEILKDVSGVFSADPKIVPQAQLIQNLKAGELLDMCRSGAKVLHYKSVLYAIEKGVKLAVGRSDTFEIGTEVETQPTTNAENKFSHQPGFAVNSIENIQSQSLSSQYDVKDFVRFLNLNSSSENRSSVTLTLLKEGYDFTLLAQELIEVLKSKGIEIDLPFIKRPSLHFFVRTSNRMKTIELIHQHMLKK